MIQYLAICHLLKLDSVEQNMIQHDTRGITSILFRLLFPCLLSTGGGRHLRLTPLLRNFPKLGQEHGCALCGRHLSRLFGHGNCNVFSPFQVQQGEGWASKTTKNKIQKRCLEGGINNAQLL